MQIKELYEYNPVVVDCIEDKEFFELKLNTDYKIPLEKLAEYYSVDLDADQNRYGHAFDICKKILGHNDQLNDIAYRAVSYLTNQLIFPKKLVGLYLEKYKLYHELDNYDDINVDNFINYMSESLELSNDYIRISLGQLDIIK